MMRLIIELHLSMYFFHYLHVLALNIHRIHDSLYIDEMNGQAFIADLLSLDVGLLDIYIQTCSIDPPTQRNPLC